MPKVTQQERHERQKMNENDKDRGKKLVMTLAESTLRENIKLLQCDSLAKYYAYLPPLPTDKTIKITNVGVYN